MIRLRPDKGRLWSWALRSQFIRNVAKLQIRLGADQVFYRWLPARAVGEVRPQPFLSLNSPTSVEIPPGAYSVQAKKAVAGKEIASAELPVPVGGTKTVTLEIPVL